MCTKEPMQCYGMGYNTRPRGGGEVKRVKQQIFDVRVLHICICGDHTKLRGKKKRGFKQDLSEEVFYICGSIV